MRRRWAALVAAVALVAAGSCADAEPRAVRSPTPSVEEPLTPSPSPSPRELEPSVEAMLGTVRRLADAGPRESVSPAYTRAAAFVERSFESLGYRVRREVVRLPAGTNDGIRVPAGSTTNVVAEPPAFDPRAPYVVVGGHLDTVPDSPGANDNASGIAVVLELARLARATQLDEQVVFVAFGGEERRRQSKERSTYAAGSFAYVAGIRGTAVRGAIVLDMVGAGSTVSLLGRGAMVAHVRSAARSLGIHAPVLMTRYYSDHLPFERAGITAAWLYGGSHPTFHTPRDVASVVQSEQLRRVARVAWRSLLDPLG